MEDIVRKQIDRLSSLLSDFSEYIDSDEIVYMEVLNDQLKSFQQELTEKQLVHISNIETRVMNRMCSIERLPKGVN